MTAHTRMPLVPPIIVLFLASWACGPDYGDKSVMCDPDAGCLLCGAVVTYILTNEANCGACGNECAIGAVCVNGECACIAPSSMCDERCVDLQSSSSDCGTCGNRCNRTGEECREGACIPPRRDAGIHDGGSDGAADEHDARVDAGPRERSG